MVRRASPVRTCVGCRRRAPASELLRIVAVTSDTGRVDLVADPVRRLPGRGAHLHHDPACLDLAVRRRVLGRALRVPGVTETGAVMAYLRSATDDGATDAPSGTAR